MEKVSCRLMTVESFKQGGVMRDCSNWDLLKRSRWLKRIDSTRQNLCGLAISAPVSSAVGFVVILRTSRRNRISAMASNVQAGMRNISRLTSTNWGPTLFSFLRRSRSPRPSYKKSQYRSTQVFSAVPIVTPYQFCATFSLNRLSTCNRSHR
jgi:hypothetical protein